MRFDSLYQFLVPLTFLAIWALTSLFNREAQPLPPRSGRMPGPNGPRPLPANANAKEPSPPRPNQPGANNSYPPRPSGTNRGDDEIIIIEAEPRRSPNTPSPRNPAQGNRRNAKTRQPAPPAPKRPESNSQRTLGPTTGLPMPGMLSQPKGLSPLELPPSPLLSTSSGETPGAEAAQARATGPVAISSVDVRNLTRSPARVRESIILSELMRPPLALRVRPRG